VRTDAAERERERERVKEGVCGIESRREKLETREAQGEGRKCGGQGRIVGKVECKRKMLSRQCKERDAYSRLISLQTHCPLPDRIAQL
jgi:hypothetical protein